MQLSTNRIWRKIIADTLWSIRRDAASGDIYSLFRGMRSCGLVIGTLLSFEDASGVRETVHILERRLVSKLPNGRRGGKRHGHQRHNKTHGCHYPAHQEA